MTTLWIDARTARTGGGRTVLDAVERHLVPTLDGLDVRLLRPDDGAPAVPLTRPGNRPDVVLGLAESGNLGLGGRRSTIMLVRNWNCWQPGGGAKNEIRRRVVAHNARVADVAVFATRTFADAVGERCRGRQEVVPFGVSDEFDPGGPVEQGEFLLDVGDWYPWKHHEATVRAFAAVSAERAALRLKIAGHPVDPALVDEALDVARSLGVTDRVDVLGSVDRSTLARLYRGAAAAVLLSDRETFGHPYLEALACGAPLVARRMPVTEEVAAAGTLVEGDEAAIAAGLSAALAGPRPTPVPPRRWSDHARELRALIVEALA